MCSYVEPSFILDLRWGGIKNPVQGRLSWEERVLGRAEKYRKKCVYTRELRVFRSLSVLLILALRRQRQVDF